MNDDNKSRVKKGLEVLLFLINLSIGIGAAVGCFNYASLAKKTGVTGEGIFWLVGVLVIVYTVFYGIWHFKKLENL